MAAAPIWKPLESPFGGDLDYAMLIRLYCPEGAKESPETRHGPGWCCGRKVEPITANPGPAHISTSYAARQNLTMRLRMRMRRFTRLSDAFSEKLESLAHVVAFFCLVRRSFGELG